METAKRLLLQKGERGHGAFTVWLDAIARERHTSARTLRRWMLKHKMKGEGNSAMICRDCKKAAEPGRRRCRVCLDLNTQRQMRLRLAAFE